MSISSISMVVLALFFLAACSDDTGPKRTPSSNNEDPQEYLLELVRAPASISRSSEASLEVSCQPHDCELSCEHNGQEFEDCGLQVALADLDAQQHRFTFRATWASGVERELEIRWLVLDPIEMEDGPQVTISETPEEITSSRQAVFAFVCSQPPCEYECDLNQSGWTVCDSPIAYEGLDDGGHEFRVRATNEEGVTGIPAGFQWLIETRLPLIVNLDGPPPLTSQNSAIFTFGCSLEDCQFFCQLDQDEERVCASGVRYDGLADGAHEFSVRAEAGAEVGPAVQWQWVVDSTVPEIINLQGPMGPTNQTTASLSFECSVADCTTECRHNAGAFGPCTSPESLSGLDDRVHTFEVRGLSSAGVTGPVRSHTWTVDTVPPVVAFTETPTSPTSGVSVRFGFQCSKADCQTECQLNAQAYQACQNTITYSNLAEGDHTFRVRGTDSAGNQSAPLEHSFEVGEVVENLKWLPSFGRSCYLHNGALTCWGLNTWGQVGNGSTSSFQFPDVPPYTHSGVWQDVSLASSSACGLKDSQVYCWGSNHDGILGTGSSASPILSPTRAGALDGYTFITHSYASSCALRAGGELYCWGGNSYGQLGTGDRTRRQTPTQITNFGDWSHVSNEGLRTCGIRGGRLYCWGSNTNGTTALGLTSGDTLTPTQVGSATNWNSVSVSLAHGCGIRAGELYCWGLRRRAGLGGTGTQTTPARVGSFSDWETVRVGLNHTCGIRSGRLYCWGENNDWQAGLDNVVLSNQPVQIGNFTDWTDVWPHRNATCASRANGQIYCTGKNEHAQLTPSLTGPRLGYEQVDFDNAVWTDVSLSFSKGCGIKSGQLYCWGFEPIGDGTELSRAIPTRIGADSNWAAVSMGMSVAYGIRNGRLYRWGYNFHPPSGHSSRELSPRQVGSLTGWQEVSVIGESGCGIRNGELYCWGYSPGNGSEVLINDLIRIGTSSQWTDISVKGTKCGIDAGVLRCWGKNSSGEVGNNTFGDALTPQPVSSGYHFQSVSVGSSHVCAIRAGVHELYCWGDNSSGQLGIGNAGTQFVPVRVGNATNWSEVSAGEDHTCARRGGELYCWGDGVALGLNSLHQRDTPTRVGTLSNYTMIGEVNARTRCAGRNNGALVCTGEQSGAIADGTGWFTSFQAAQAP